MNKSPKAPEGQLALSSALKSLVRLTWDHERYDCHVVDETIEIDGLGHHVKLNSSVIQEMRELISLLYATNTTSMNMNEELFRKVKAVDALVLMIRHESEVVRESRSECEQVRSNLSKLVTSYKT